ncbi:MAG: hypothetical protein EOO09_20890 [Chitinophagaceae bacterium]|nr:MAG: hypothetical protein EOO09_20890 [Chitinophagaceae bacterium]
MKKPILLTIAVLVISLTAYTQSCTPTEDESVYGTNNRWRAYFYQGITFNVYKGMRLEATTANPSFDQNFGGPKVNYTTSACTVVTDTFSVRYRLRKTFTHGIYTFVVGADAGYRFSMDGGATWAVTNWNPHTYTTSSHNVTLNGTYDMVVEYYDNLGGNRISFNMIQNTVLPVGLLSFTASSMDEGVRLEWKVSEDASEVSFEVQGSSGESGFSTLAKVTGTSAASYQYMDRSNMEGTFFYRIKITGFNGDASYSKSVAVRLGSNPGIGIKIFPTLLTSNVVYIQNGRQMENVTVAIFDGSGNRHSINHIGRLAAGGRTAVNVSSSKLSPGVYFVQVLEGRLSAALTRIVVQ